MTTADSIPRFTRRDDLIAWIGVKLGDVDVHGIEFICPAENSDSILCFIDVDREIIYEAHHRLGGQIFGYATLVLEVPVAGHLSCPPVNDGIPLLDHLCSCKPPRNEG